MAQQGQVFSLAGQGGGSTQWAYRYRVGGHFSPAMSLPRRAPSSKSQPRSSGNTASARPLRPRPARRRSTAQGNPNETHTPEAEGNRHQERPTAQVLLLGAGCEERLHAAVSTSFLLSVWAGRNPFTVGTESRRKNDDDSDVDSHLG
jgi:hypothetical protein